MDLVSLLFCSKISGVLGRILASPVASSVTKLVVLSFMVDNLVFIDCCKRMGVFANFHLSTEFIQKYFEEDC